MPTSHTLKRYEAVFLTVQDIIASRRVRQFCIGITGKPHDRKAGYSRWCRKYGAESRGFVLLDWDRKPDEIVDFEKSLFAKASKSKKYGNYENVAYFRNVNRKFDHQAIYVAWWDQEIYKPGGLGYPEKVLTIPKR